MRRRLVKKDDVHICTVKLNLVDHILYYIGIYVYADSELANQSIQQLSSALPQLDPDEEQVEEVGGGNEDHFTTMAEEDKAAWSQKSQSEAGDLVTTEKVSSVHLDAAFTVGDTLHHLSK